MTATADLDLAPARKPVDCWWTVFAVDPVAMRVLPFLLRRAWVTPNRITAAAFGVGVASVALFATGHLVAGAVVYELRFFLDCLDGKLARVRRVSSPLGAACDRLADAFTIPAAYAAVGWTLAERHHWSRALVLSVALMSVLVTVAELSLDAVRNGRPQQPTATAADSAAGVIGWMRRHRLTLRPWTVEAETLGLFLGPLVLAGDALADLELCVAAAYAVFVLIDLALLVRAASPQPYDGDPEASHELGDRP
jgi:phosphatidylglycerophosphate synthase